MSYLKHDPFNNGRMIAPLDKPALEANAPLAPLGCPRQDHSPLYKECWDNASESQRRAWGRAILHAVREAHHNSSLEHRLATRRALADAVADVKAWEMEEI